MRRAVFLGIAALVPLGCFDLDGFAGGSPSATPDGGGGGGEASTVTPNAVPDAGAETSTPAPDASADPYGDAVFADNPSAYFRFEEPVGSTSVVDATGQHSTATYGNVVFRVPGVVGYAATFDGTSGFNLGDVFDFDGTTEFALEFWGQDDHPTADYESVMFKRLDDPNPTDGWLVFLQKSDHTLQFQFWQGGNVNQGTCTDQAFHGVHHTVIVRTASGESLSLAMYVDGVLQTNSDNYGSQGAEPATAQTLQVGGGWEGMLDEIAIYEHPLTPDRVVAHYNAAPGK